MSNFIYENTWEENQEAMKTKKLAIIPVGSSEQHGPALPVGTDWIIADYLARRVGEKTDKGLVTPVFPYGHALYLSLIHIYTAHPPVPHKYFPGSHPAAG